MEASLYKYEKKCLTDKATQITRRKERKKRLENTSPTTALWEETMAASLLGMTQNTVGVGRVAGREARARRA